MAAHASKSWSLFSGVKLVGGGVALVMACRLEADWDAECEAEDLVDLDLVLDDCSDDIVSRFGT